MMDSDTAGTNGQAVTSFFGIGAVLIMLTMIQLGAYVYNNKKVSSPSYPIMFCSNRPPFVGVYERTFSGIIFCGVLLVSRSHSVASFEMCTMYCLYPNDTQSNGPSHWK